MMLFFLVDVTTEDKMSYIVSSMGYGMGYIGSIITIPFIICIIVVLLSQNRIL